MEEIIEVLNLSGIYFITTDFEWNILEISKEFLKKLNYSSKDILTLKIIDLITEEYKETITMFLLNYKGEPMKHNINWNFHTKYNYINSCKVTSMKYNEKIIFLLTEENIHNKITNNSLNMLTGEKSINFFIEEIEKDLYIDKDIKFSILSINIENFNRIIEKYGFEKKDYIIDLFLKKIRKIIPIDNVIATTETNQIYIYLKRVNTKLIVLHYINSILEESKKIIFFGNKIEFILKMGVSMYPDNGSDIKVLIDKSNLAATYPNTINYYFYKD
ncbi:GGDEF domain-containing protein [Hypnocyclicus thermotrophus]|uniref:GGDEF domain-containing protein n=1 Tax=Hypnocyclicus thermotrophus TaxID=1627895 RepID=A0AA46I6A4_9FUSO|nr:diguanylate cyclase [Hypnocyclicus thermotrophus]TDT72280.1 GGDEF domain-containing protein [Hypnocyclicus thermotrophus]